MKIDSRENDSHKKAQKAQEKSGFILWLLCLFVANRFLRLPA
ncbi:MAG: hypothetical protein PHX38_10760 [Sulfuricella sp.]|nr:hypothetical protein [Sulfuricella sp.]